ARVRCGGREGPGRRAAAGRRSPYRTTALALARCGRTALTLGAAAPRDSASSCLRADALTGFSQSPGRARPPGAARGVGCAGGQRVELLAGRRLDRLVEQPEQAVPAGLAPGRLDERGGQVAVEKPLQPGGGPLGRALCGRAVRARRCRGDE